jgi:hypothetical protein
MIMMDIEMKSEEPQNSIKVSKNSRGYTWEIKRYFAEPIEDTDGVIKWLKAVDMKLREQFEREEEKPVL